MALATRLAAATERYWAVFGALALVLSFYDAVWTPVLAMLPLPFPPLAMAWGFVLDALFLAGIAAHAALLTREAWRARLHSAGFFVDLACCLPIEALGLAGAGRVMPELRLIKLLRLYRVDHVLCARIREDVRWNWNRLAVVRIIVLIALVTHWCGVAWARVGLLPGGWVAGYAAREGWDVGDTPTVYLRALYWACVTMTTVGYGDVVPASDEDVVVATVVMVVGHALYAAAAA